MPILNQSPWLPMCLPLRPGGVEVQMVNTTDIKNGGEGFLKGKSSLHYRSKGRQTAYQERSSDVLGNNRKQNQRWYLRSFEKHGNEGWGRGQRWLPRGKGGKKHTNPLTGPPNFVLCWVEPEAQENTGEKSHCFLPILSHKRITKWRLGTHAIWDVASSCLRGTDSKANCWWRKQPLNTAFIYCLWCIEKVIGAVGHKNEQRPCLQTSQSSWGKRLRVSILIGRHPSEMGTSGSNLSSAVYSWPLQALLSSSEKRVTMCIIAVEIRHGVYKAPCTVTGT